MCYDKLLLTKYFFFLTQNKLDKEKDKDEKYSPKNCKLRRLSKPPFQTNSSPEMVTKLDLSDAKNSDTAHIKSIEITSILNGLQGKHKNLLHASI